MLLDENFLFVVADLTEFSIGGLTLIQLQSLTVTCICVFRLSSAVAEHRRSVRPSRRTQGSRNPLRALAAREDIRQDYMGDRISASAEERAQAEKSEFSCYCCCFIPFLGEGFITAKSPVDCFCWQSVRTPQGPVHRSVRSRILPTADWCSSTSKVRDCGLCCRLCHGVCVVMCFFMNVNICGDR